MINSLKLIYFKGCPEANTAKQALANAGISGVEEILQDNLPKESIYRKYTSPSILVNDKLVYGMVSSNFKPACSFDLLNFFDEKKIIQSLKQLL